MLCGYSASGICERASPLYRQLQPCNDHLLGVYVLTEDPASRTTPYLPAYQVLLASTACCAVRRLLRTLSHVGWRGAVPLPKTAHKAATESTNGGSRERQCILWRDGMEEKLTCNERRGELIDSLQRAWGPERSRTLESASSGLGSDQHPHAHR